MLTRRSCLVLQSTALRAMQTTTSVAVSKKFQYESLAIHNDTLLPAHKVMRRVLKYLLVDPKFLKGSILTEEARSLPYKTIFTPQQVMKLTSLVRWGFQQLEGDSLAADAVFKALEPHANMTRGTVWRQYFQRQFFISNAPLWTYLRVYKTHLDALAAAKDQATAENRKAEVGEDENKEVNKAAFFTTVQKNTSRREKVFSGKKREVTILDENKNWDWVPLPVAFSIVKEFCFRGRFAEAIEAYVLLPMTDSMSRDVVATLQAYEQYSSVLCLYEVHRALGSAGNSLDVAPELDALNKVGRTEEVKMRFQKLSIIEQSRSDIQKIIGN
ncbi:hypothetical protein CCR75_009403 [Bremia lactucae]|uniref:Uncharacterized protein n=1 Tax=Bremia lactucae TaxID=4779 RepID=A0A976NZ35_BRELC|nr:hypothetical protein CCR75_009403 [Bremia lactucae]